MKRVLAVLSCACAIWTSGCVFECTEVGCTSNVQLVVPLDASDTSATVEVCRGEVCYSAVEVSAESAEVDIFENAEVRIQASFETQTTETPQVRVSALYIEASNNDAEPPTEEWTVTVVTGGGAELSGSVVPEYTRSAPNGEACGPICYQASETIQ